MRKKAVTNELDLWRLEETCHFKKDDVYYNLSTQESRGFKVSLATQEDKATSSCMRSCLK